MYISRKYTKCKIYMYALDDHYYYMFNNTRLPACSSGSMPMSARGMVQHDKTLNYYNDETTDSIILYTM